MHGFKPWITRSILSATVALAVVANTAIAQCPDGTPPPCKRPVGVPLLRRTNPPLDGRAWIVVPFGNVMKAPDLEVAKGRPQEAKIWYDKLLDLWSAADAEFLNG